MHPSLILDEKRILKTNSIPLFFFLATDDTKISFQ